MNKKVLRAIAVTAGTLSAFAAFAMTGSAADLPAKGGTLAAGEYTLTKDMSISTAYTISDGTVTLDLNGYTLTTTTSYAFNLNGYQGGKPKLIINDSVGGGAIAGGTTYTIFAHNQAEVEMNAGSVSGKVGIRAEMGSSNAYAPTNITINGGTVSGTAKGIEAMNYNGSKFGTLTINKGAKVSGGQFGVYIMKYNTTVDKAEISCTGTGFGSSSEPNSAVYAFEGAGTLTITDSDITSTSDNCLTAKGYKDITISNTDITGAAYGIYAWSSTDISVTGGTVNGGTAGLYRRADKGDITMTGATVSGIEYYNGANSLPVTAYIGDLTLDSCTVTGPVWDGGSNTPNMKGITAKDTTFKENVTLFDRGAQMKPTTYPVFVTVGDPAVVKLDGCTFLKTLDIKGNEIGVTINSGTFGGDVNVSEDADLVINGGTFNGDLSISNNGYAGAEYPICTYSNGEYTQTAEKDDLALTISGGTFNGDIYFGSYVDADIIAGIFNGTETKSDNIEGIRITGGTYANNDHSILNHVVRPGYIYSNTGIENGAYVVRSFKGSENLRQSELVFGEGVYAVGTDKGTYHQLTTVDRVLSSKDTATFKITATDENGNTTDYRHTFSHETVVNGEVIVGVYITDIPEGTIVTATYVE